MQEFKRDAIIIKINKLKIYKLLKVKFSDKKVNQMFYSGKSNIKNLINSSSNVNG